ncbi:MAG TPA: TIM barrel protein [Planctomycetota bacterium]|nr:TIM barrel protein [Planctomycetota bacterium]
MRLGGFFGANTAADLEPLCEKLDCYGLSAIPAPWKTAEMPDDDCIRFGEDARRLGIVVGEAGIWDNLMTPNEDVQFHRIEKARELLRKADLMGCRCAVSLVGTKDASDHPLAPHPYMFTDECRAEFREVVLRILDGFELRTVRYGIEPWHNTFFYKPEDIREFVDSVGHPAFGLHLDQMNMISQSDFFNTTGLINTTFDLLADKVWSVHLKDLRCDHKHMFLKWDEVNIGDGVMDYRTFLTRLAKLPADTSCYCEHMAEERDYALNFARLHRFAQEAGVRFMKRDEEMKG